MGAGKKRIKLSTGISLLPKFWDKEKQRVKRHHPNAATFNHVLSTTENQTEEIQLISRQNGTQITPALLRARLKLFNDVEQETSDFIAAFEQYLKAQAVTFASGTLRSNTQNFGHLKEFSKANSVTLTFANIDADFYDALQAYFLQGERFVNSTFNRLRKVLVSFLNWATDKEINSNISYKKFKKLPELQTESIALTEAELNIIRAAELDERLHYYRDLFLLECFTGLRYSDLQHIKTEAIKGHTLSFTSTKTRQKLSIPLPPPAKEILANRLTPGEALYIPANQVFNRALKDIGEAAGLKESVTITRYSGSKRIDTTYKKFELIATHTGRRTFCNIALKKKVPAQFIMAITGHKTEASFKKYLRITQTDVSQALDGIFK